MNTTSSPSASITVISIFPEPPSKMATGKVALYLLLGTPFSMTSTWMEWKVKISKGKQIRWPLVMVYHFYVYFCASHHQFNALFERTINRHAKKQKGDFLTDSPYTSIHAIPVNDSGTFLLWCLLEFSPMETEEVLRNSLMDRSDDFHFQSNNIYPLTYASAWTWTVSSESMSCKNHSS